MNSTLIFANSIHRIQKYTRELITIGCAVLAGFMMVGWLNYTFKSFAAVACDNDIIFHSLSPDKKLKVVVFERGCGATTGNSQHISLLNANEALPDDGGNVLSGDERSADSIHIKWKSNTLLEISGAYWRKDSNPETVVNGVQIHYK